MGDGSEQGSIPEGAERGRVRSSIRQRGAVPCGGGQMAVAGRLRLPALRRPAAQRNQDPRALSVHRLPAADVADCRDDLHGDQACAAELVSRPLSSDPEQAGHLQPGARPPPRRHPDDGGDGQAQTQAGDDGARRQEAPDRPPRDGRRLPRRPPLRRQAGTRRGWQDADRRHRRDHRRRPAGAPQAAPGAGLPAQRDRGLGQAQPGCRLHRRQRWSGVFPGGVTAAPAAATSRSAPARAARPSSRLPSSGSTPRSATSRRRSSVPIGRSATSTSRAIWPSSSTASTAATTSPPCLPRLG